MRYIETLRDGDRVMSVFLCKSKTSSINKNGKEFENVILQDKTGQIEAKIWDVGSAGICDFDALDYVEITGMVSNYNGALQIKIDRARKVREGEYDPADFLPVSKKDIEVMYKELTELINSVKNPYLNKLLKAFLVNDEEMVKRFKTASAAKSVHHGFIGGLLEHTLSVAKICDAVSGIHTVLNRDLLLTAAILHDIGKTKEISAFPYNDYTDDGNLLGHIVMGSEMISEQAKLIEGFPARLESELKHCILAHHGKLEYGSPKKPALIEAVALSFADDMDAKLESFTELMDAKDTNDWLGFSKNFESNIRKTSI